MFNLIVGASRWESEPNSFVRSRIFEHTEDHLRARFAPEGELDYASLQLLPTLFMPEGTGDDDHAHVGTVTRVSPNGRDSVLIEYAIDQHLPPIQLSKIYEIRGLLQMDEWEFSRHHWAVKDVDLYRALVRQVLRNRNVPTAFVVANPPVINPLQLSAMMPFTATFTPVYQTIAAAAADNGMICNRADNIFEHSQVMQDIASLIDRSRIVVVDCTGKNPNVFYEVGIAHTLGREVILLTQSEADVPFDLRHHRFIQYLNNGEGLTDMQQRLTARIGTLLAM